MGEKAVHILPCHQGEICCTVYPSVNVASKFSTVSCPIVTPTVSHCDFKMLNDDIILLCDVTDVNCDIQCTTVPPLY